MTAMRVTAGDMGRTAVRTGARSALLDAAVVLSGAAACALSLAAPPLRGLPMHPVAQLIHVGVTTAYVGAGTVALARQPGNATGPLMIAVGFLWLIPDLGWIPGALSFTIADAYPQLYQPVLAHLALAFPAGRLPGRLERRVVIGLYVWTLVNNLVIAMFSDPAAAGCAARCPRNLLLVDSSMSVENALSHVATSVSIVLVITTAGLIVRHWWRATRAAQYVMAPVLWVVGPAAAYIAIAQIADLVGLAPAGQRIVNDYLPLGLAVLPIGFLIGLLRTRLAYAHIGTLAAELGGPIAPGRVRGVLARMLHDPELELLYWSPSTNGYVDIDGNPRDLGSGYPHRTVAPIRGDSGPLAVMIVDHAVLQEPGLLKAAEAMTRLALENERLQAEVRSQLLQLRSTTGRLLEAGQEARRHLERDLHDGAQQRLLALSMSLGQARTRLGTGADPAVRQFLDKANDDLQLAITELRELARGIHPMLLTQEGLRSALRALAERAPVPVQVTAPTGRFSDTVEATVYFLVSEAVTNAARHSHAHRVVVILRRDGAALTVEVSDDGVGGADEASGSGLQGMRDRITAVGGQMTVASAAGVGTRIVASLPCG